MKIFDHSLLDSFHASNDKEIEQIECCFRFLGMHSSSCFSRVMQTPGPLKLNGPRIYLKRFVNQMVYATLKLKK